MTIVHKAGNLHTNSNEPSRWALGNTPDNPDYVHLEAEPQIPIKGINITDIVTEFFEEVRESYKKDKNCHIFTELSYKMSAYSSTGKTPAILEKGCNPALLADTMRKDLIDIHPTASSFQLQDYA
ncbi:hypothetical protein O181_030495 [Austropuccinia psidii MF-1]|uniref:Uncharacterized protein n=1 Tax=Austropuccinia psidii MF-1 TaxID=1389203 RepID=A0A9Q3H6A0_9BASI|nr:hypothetical protein [Austropuccinia psidii MF-1]